MMGAVSGPADTPPLPTQAVPPIPTQAPGNGPPLPGKQMPHPLTAGFEEFADRLQSPAVQKKIGDAQVKLLQKNQAVFNDPKVRAMSDEQASKYVTAQYNKHRREYEMAIRQALGGNKEGAKLTPTQDQKLKRYMIEIDNWLNATDLKNGHINR